MELKRKFYELLKSRKAMSSGTTRHLTDLAEVKALSIGLNPAGHDLTYWIRKVRLYTKDCHNHN